MQAHFLTGTWLSNGSTLFRHRFRHALDLALFHVSTYHTRSFACISLPQRICRAYSPLSEYIAIRLLDVSVQESPAPRGGGIARCHNTDEGDCSAASTSIPAERVTLVVVFYGLDKVEVADPAVAGAEVAEEGGRLLLVEGDVVQVEELLELKAVDRAVLVAVEVVEHSREGERRLRALVQLIRDYLHHVRHRLARGERCLAVARRDDGLRLDQRGRAILPAAAEEAAVGPVRARVDGALLLPGFGGARGEGRDRLLEGDEVGEPAVRVFVVIPRVRRLEA